MNIYNLLFTIYFFYKIVYYIAIFLIFLNTLAIKWTILYVFQNVKYIKV